jgi:hypothetical protein
MSNIKDVTLEELALVGLVKIEHTEEGDKVTFPASLLDS